MAKFTIVGHTTGTLARLENLTPLEPELERIFRRGKREQILTGRSSTGRPFAPLARSTLERGPRQSTLPFLARGQSSSLLTRYQVDVTFASASVTVSAGWPMRWVKYHVTGGPKLPRRDPTGFRQEDIDTAKRVFREYVTMGTLPLA
jgi:hypothetical protein